MPKRYDYVTVDVFTDRAFAGNPLAVVTDATGLHTHQMQGVEMGRPSLLQVSAEKTGGAVTRVRVGGRCAPVMDGTLTV